MAEKTKIRFIIQIAGKPVENVNRALEFVEKKLKESETFKLKESEIIEPELDEETSLYSGLIEGLGVFDNYDKIFQFILDFTPNSIEVEEPEYIKLDSASFTGMLNDFSNHMLKSASQIRKLNAAVHQLNNKSENKTKTKK